MPRPSDSVPSLENLVEHEELGVEILHPGGLEITKELAELCRVQRGSRVLDVASGTGESACFLANEFACEVVGVDMSEFMVKRARAKAAERHSDVTFQQGDAHELAFDAGAFDAVISECTTCILDKERAIAEMARVARPGGYVGIHDICWKEETPLELEQRLEELEGERPETLDGWMRLFRGSGLEDVVGIDKSALVPGWTKEIRRSLGLFGELRLLVRVFRRWGIRGYRHIAESERILSSHYTGYGIIVGRKPLAAA